MTTSTDALIAEASEALGVAPDGVVLVPGRVDLLGSHTDYNRLPVLACAVDLWTAIAYRKRSDCEVRLRNADAEYPETAFGIGPDIPAAAAGDWSNYARAAAQELAKTSDIDLRGMDAGFASTLPPRAGLSSSSALVVGVAMALRSVNDRPYDRVELAQRLASAEHYVGTRGGGLDHATILCSKQDHVLELDFDPLQTAKRRFPDGTVLLLCHSRVSAPKSAATRYAYNRRVAECRVGAACLARDLGMRPWQAGRWLRLGDLCDTLDADSLRELLAGVENTLPRDAVSADWVAAHLPDLPSPLDLGDGHPLPEPDDGFQIAKRVRHVVGEAVRVRAGARAVEAGDPAALASLMDASQTSAREVFETSCPEVDALIEMLRAEGAPAARMCGAGFGGMVAALVRDADAPGLAKAVGQRPEVLGEAGAGHKPLIVRPAAGAADLPS